jgi:hypothetical protein
MYCSIKHSLELIKLLQVNESPSPSYRHSVIVQNTPHTMVAVMTTTRLILALALGSSLVRAFSAPALVSTRKRQVASVAPCSASNNDEDDEPSYMLPATSFGSEAVPEGQRPVNEYLDLIRAPLFGWASEETGTQGLLLRLGAVYVITFATVCYPISGATFTQDGFELQKLAASNVGALLMEILLLIRLYSGWGYVGSRLRSKVVEYEETGWYDGDFEEKTENERIRDQFLYNSNVKPVEERLKLISLVTCGLFVAASIGFNASMSIQPIFNEYDPKMLERMRYDGAC